MMDPSQPLQVTAAILHRDGRILLTQRPFSKGYHLSGLWEFPGGKVEPGESHREALIREMEEELGIEMGSSRYFCHSLTRQRGRLIELHCYLVAGFSGIISLKEHRAALWLPPGRLSEFPLAPGDVAPVDRLIRESALLNEGGDFPASRAGRS